MIQNNRLLTISRIVITLVFFCFGVHARVVTWKMGKLSIDGNQVYSKNDLHSLMDLRPKFQLGGVTFSASKLNADISSLEKFYKSQGFLNVGVKTDEVQKDSSHHRVFVKINILEGPRTTIRSVQIFSSRGLISSDALDKKLSSEIGQPLISQTLNYDTDLLRKNLTNRGFLAAKVKPEITIDSTLHVADITFDVNEGPLVTVDEIKINGTKRVRSKVITREMKFSSGQVLTESVLRQSEQQLYKTNLFNYAHIEPALGDTADSVNTSELSDGKYNVAINVNEADFFRIQGGVGYGTSSGPRASLESSYANLFGVGHNVTLRGNVSLKDQKIEGIYYTPWFFGLPLQFNGTLYLNRHSDSTTYYGTFRGLRLALGRATSYHMLYQTWFNWEGGSIKYTKDTVGVASPDIPVKSFGVGITYDTRNDFLNPETGIYNLFQVEASGIIPNSSKFVKVTDDFRYLWKVRSLSFGSGLKLGWIRPYGGTTGLQAQELFFAGGARTVRGFKENLLRSDTTGGSFMVTANLLEMRFPLFWWFQGAVFTDCGYVWNITPDRHEPISFRDIRWTAGPGIRLNTPIAVVRLDMGFKLDRRPKENLFEFHFDLGQVF